MTPDLAIALTIFMPAGATLLLALLDKYPNARETVSLTTAATLFLVVMALFQDLNAGVVLTSTWFNVLPGLPLAFEIEPLGMLFATIASGLWIVTAVYSIGYMRGNKEKHQTRFYICFAIAISASMGIAFAGNMFTLFIFYEILTLSTYPLVAHKETTDARRGARTYLGILIGTSIGFQLIAIIWTWAAAGTLDFSVGGILRDKIDPTLLPFLLALYAFGIGKAALMPFHRWLPAAMVAPTPVSALLHAVAVVKAGVFTMLKVGVYIFGIDLLAETGASEWLMWLAGFSIIAASIVAMTKDNLKARLAYSTISQLSYITLGMALATSLGVMGGAMHIAMHAMGKITLFMCAGAIYVATHKTEISEMDGLGRAMPFTYAAFLIGALSIIGLPPLGGSWSKYYLMLGAADTGQLVMIGVFMLSSLLNIAYLLPVVARGFYLGGRPAHALSAAPSSRGGIQEAPIWCVVPPCLTAIGCILLFFYAGDIYTLIEPVAFPAGTLPEGASLP
ncbi:MAG: monovalent cation/H+ antiporter subunit D family protein [Alphaproteobacteria bacterium]|jgi:multicomponent Na+:H+ antiporter subunit D|nr:monovalent cation/H+ antiporter subunit D family protein [Alphaproteobacteria bacterium]MBO6629110.1 monovalent cation/H+ antiporter subunit D family protein [Alphaproteobacteria bacterium]MDF1624887.1 monovalent cation/H+ antiporter subunit D family protein [Parvibaculaceae bacterium]